MTTRMKQLNTFTLILLSALAASGAEKYSGPRPPKPDVPYLLHADNLLPTEVVDAKEETGKKDETTYAIAGTASSARTPLAEPIFLLLSDKVIADKLELYKFDVKNGRRELVMSRGKRKGAKALHLSVDKLDGKLYKVEASEPLDNGQYSLSPSGSNQVFCFEIY